MLKKIIGSIFVAFAVITVSAQDINKTWKQAETQLSLLYNEAKANRVKQQVFPRSLSNDSLKLVASGDWTSGFFPGMLWMMYDRTRDTAWKSKAEEFTALMEKEITNRNSHDVGFKVYNSFGKGYEVTNNATYKEQIIQAARTLASRFNAKTGLIRSWDFGKWQFPVIIDNMMNLELLFKATRMSGDSSFYRIAVSHADMTMKNHFRPDFSSYHVVDYDTITGKMIRGGTHQGYADSSSWARGQAWALYGFTMCYRETGNQAYLTQAMAIADFILNHKNLPKDKIPYWDFDAPGKNQPRDASAAAIIACALIELKVYAGKPEYTDISNLIVKNLTKKYRAKLGTHKGFILLHSTGHKPVNGEVDTSIIYADYYYLEALMRIARPVKVMLTNKKP